MREQNADMSGVRNRVVSIGGVDGLGYELLGDLPDRSRLPGSAEHKCVCGENGRLGKQEQFGRDSRSGVHGRGRNRDNARDGKMGGNSSGDGGSHGMTRE